LTAASSSAQDTPSATFSRVISSGSALILFGAFYEVSRRGLLIWGGQFETDWQLVNFGLAAALCVGLPWVPPQYKRRVLLGASLLVGLSILRWLVVLPVLMAWLASRVSRAAWSNFSKLALLLGIWVLVPVLTWFGPLNIRYRYDELAMYWSTIFAPLICLVVERGRGQLDDLQPLDDWLYLLVFPRFFLPFIQPIGVRRLLDSWRDRPDARVAARGLALGLYGMLGYWVIHNTFYALKSPPAPFSVVNHGPQILTNALRVYAFNATNIFCAVALLRLVGFDVGSGFRYPLLSSSIADGFRRWNYYFFEFATSILYLPLVAWLRRAMPLRLAYVLAGYPSVLIGVWAIYNIFGTWPFGRYGVQMGYAIKDWHALLGYIGVWSLIMLPQALFAPFRRLRGARWWRVVSHVLTFATGAFLATYCFVSGITLY
jgi:hypothetical protein